MVFLDRLGAVSGVVGIPLVVTGVVLADPASSLNAGPSSEARLVAQALTENASAARVGVYCSLLGVLLLIVFLGRLHGAVSVGLVAGSWWPSVVLVGGGGLVAVLLAEAGVALAASESAGYAADSQVAKAFLLLGWGSAALVAPCLSAILLAGSVAALTSSGLPTWLGWAGAVLFAVAVLLLLLNAAGMATAPGMLWLFAAAIVLLFTPPQPTAGQTAASGTPL